MFAIERILLVIRSRDAEDLTESRHALGELRARFVDQLAVLLRRRFEAGEQIQLKAALGAGVPSVEIDVQLSRDGVPMVIHDTGLARTAGIDRRVSDLSAEELTAIAIHEPARFGTRFDGERLPRLADIVELLGNWPEARAFVEIKRESAEAHGVDETVALVLDVLGPVRERCVVISFVERAVMSARRLGAPATGWVP